jgi:hypothetical protein
VRQLTILFASSLVCLAVAAPTLSPVWAQSSGPIQPSLPWGAKQRSKPNPQDQTTQDDSQGIQQNSVIKPLQGDPEKPRGEPTKR